MSSLQIRHLPDDVYQALSLRAERAKRSLAQQALVELREQVEDGGRMVRSRVLAEIRQSLASASTSTSASARALPPPEQWVREDRER